MIYKITIKDETLEIDDNVFFDKQKKRFKELFNELKEYDSAEFDNCTVTVFDNGRVIITEKHDDNE